MMDGDSEAAAAQFRESHESAPDNPVLGLLYGQALTMNGQQDEAIRVFDALGERFADLFFGSLARFYIASMRPDTNDVSETATSSLFEACRSDPQWSWCIAQCYALLGVHDKAIDWVANAVGHGFWNYPLLAERDTLLAPLREHESYQSLMAELHKKWMYLEA